MLRGEVVRFQRSISMIRVLGEIRKWGKSQECHQIWCLAANAYPLQGMTVKENMPQDKYGIYVAGLSAGKTIERSVGYAKDMRMAINVHGLLTSGSYRSMLMFCSVRQKIPRREDGTAEEQQHSRT